MFFFSVEHFNWSIDTRNSTIENIIDKNMHEHSNFLQWFACILIFIVFNWSHFCWLIWNKSTKQLEAYCSRHWYKINHHLNMTVCDNTYCSISTKFRRVEMGPKVSPGLIKFKLIPFYNQQLHYTPTSLSSL
jgi:hypothetical protein